MADRRIEARLSTAASRGAADLISRRLYRLAGLTWPQTPRARRLLLRWTRRRSESLCGCWFDVVVPVFTALPSDQVGDDGSAPTSIEPWIPELLIRTLCDLQLNR